MPLSQTSDRTTFFAKPNRPGAAVQWDSNERFGDWVYSAQERVIGAGLRQCRDAKRIFRLVRVRRLL